MLFVAFSLSVILLILSFNSVSTTTLLPSSVVSLLASISSSGSDYSSPSISTSHSLSTSATAGSSDMSSFADDANGVPPLPTTGNPNVLLTGGAGYIGTHTIVCLINSGYDVTVVDNLVNSNVEALRRVVEITGCDSSRVRFYKTDLCDFAALERVFSTSPRFHSCIHFAGLKAVGESVQKPLLYYRNNLDSTINLLELMVRTSEPHMHYIYIFIQFLSYIVDLGGGTLTLFAFTYLHSLILSYICLILTSF